MHSAIALAVLLASLIQAQPAPASVVVEIRLLDDSIQAGEMLAVEVALRNTGGRDLWLADDLLPNRTHETLLRLADHRFLTLERRAGDAWQRVSDDCGYGGAPWPQKVVPQRIGAGKERGDSLRSAPLHRKQFAVCVVREHLLLGAESPPRP